MVARYLTSIGSPTQIKNYLELLKEFNLKVSVEARFILRPSLLEAVEIKVEGEKLEINRLLNELETN